MRVTPTALPDVLMIEPRLFRDERGSFFESYNQRALAEHGIQAQFVQDNQSTSTNNVLRGLHYQIEQPQGKLLRVVRGEIFDVTVDLRRSSPTFGRWAGEILSAENNRMLWIPPGFAHGFLVRSETADVTYKTTDFYAPQFERTIVWNDRELAIDWPLSGAPIVSAKDAAGLSFGATELFA
ncbi:MAG: dTDP-4-dehydrorhamnose 3,5-epimerase [Betaproteobacteria bacterium]